MIFLLCHFAALDRALLLKAFERFPDYKLAGIILCAPPAGCGGRMDSLERPNFLLALY
jgi:hypothetical protein